MKPKTITAVERIAKLLGGQRRRSNPWAFVCDVLLEQRFGYVTTFNPPAQAQGPRVPQRALTGEKIVADPPNRKTIPMLAARDAPSQSAQLVEPDFRTHREIGARDQIDGVMISEVDGGQEN